MSELLQIVLEKLNKTNRSLSEAERLLEEVKKDIVFIQEKLIWAYFGSWVTTTTLPPGESWSEAKKDSYYRYWQAKINSEKEQIFYVSICQFIIEQIQMIRNRLESLRQESFTSS